MKRALITDGPIWKIHSKKKKYIRAPFLVLQVAQIEDSIQYLDGTNSTWKDQGRNLGVYLIWMIKLIIHPLPT